MQVSLEKVRRNQIDVQAEPVLTIYNLDACSVCLYI
jgi:hypothetical protein